MMPTTPIGSRVISTSTPGRTEAIFSPARRSASPAKKAKIWLARIVSPMPSARVLPSSRDSSLPSSSLRARISSATRRRTSWRSCGVERAQPWPAAFAAAIAAATWAALARAYSPTTSPVFEARRFGALDPVAGDEVRELLAHVQSPAMISVPRRQIAGVR
jgi:hypothetical protein